MQIIIDIPNALYEGMKNPGLCGYCSDCDIVNDAIANGRPLPKGHGRLIDADELEQHIEGFKKEVSQ